MRPTEGRVYIFTKSGNEVRVIAPSEPVNGQATWLVERTKDASAGKRMIVPQHALQPVR